MNLETVRAFGGQVVALTAQVGHGIQQHPLIFGGGLLFLLLTWSHFKGDYGPQTWSLAPERNKFLRGFVHILVIPVRLLASLFSSLVALLVIALLVGFGYVIWRVLQG